MLNYLNNKGDFSINHAENISYSYFPLCNNYGMKSAITPTQQGDIKRNQHQFLMPPVTQDELHRTGNSRNLWIKLKDEMPFSANGDSAAQRIEPETLKIEAGFLWHKVILEHKKIQCESLSFVPHTQAGVELLRVTVTNHRDSDIEFTPWYAVPLYGRSADNVRDHRHVTALLNHMKIIDHGIINQPTLTFDERGHHKNITEYGVVVNTSVNQKCLSYFPVLEEYIGEGGSMDWPKSILSDMESNYRVGDVVSGYEGIGGFKFDVVTLKPKESVCFYVAHLISEKSIDANEIITTYLNDGSFNALLQSTENYWEQELSTLSIRSGVDAFNHWMKWVALQPILRRIYGCSFLPHHDYGRGGRGWRDLWQDCLALIVMNPSDVREMLYNNYAGVRLDGTNATIIGERLGEFKADRNNIPRVWMDHGLWPLITTQLYLDRTGDTGFVLEKQSYFKDENTHYGKKKFDLHPVSEQDTSGNKAVTLDGHVYNGTILEHILVQNLVAVHNLGEHHVLRLEGADWNDGLDMAKDRGESVAFTAAYVGNMSILINLLKHLIENGIKELELEQPLVEFIVNVDHLNEREALNVYFDAVSHGVIKRTANILIDVIIERLQERKSVLTERIQAQEWLEIDEKSGFFNGYYDNSGNQLESVVKVKSGDEEKTEVNMTLTGQVFTVMSKIATFEQTRKIVNAVDAHLFDVNVGGYKLNTNYNEVKLDMGRLFGFAYGHKENGAMFSHMAIMYANALYQQGFVDEGFKVIKTLFDHVHRFETSKIYPGIPEYVDPRGRGMYHYLTGSASWLILTMLNEVFGVQGAFGDLILKPAIPTFLLDGEYSVTIRTFFRNKNIHITYIYENEDSLPKNNRVDSCSINGHEYVLNGIARNEMVHVTDDIAMLKIQHALFEKEGFSSNEIDMVVKIKNKK